MGIREIDLSSSFVFLESMIGSLYDLGGREPRGSSRSRMGLEMGSKDLSDVGIEGDMIGFTSMGSLDIPYGSSSEISEFS
jgi:hypothetical protein